MHLYTLRAIKLTRHKQGERRYSCLQAGITIEPSRKADSYAAEARQSILTQILLPDAADRLGRIRLVKESRAVEIENRLIMLARSGQLRQKVTEEQLKELLNAVAGTQEEEKIIISRRKPGWDEEDDLLDL